MSSNPEVICLHSIDIDPKLIDAAKSECNDLDLSATAPFKIFPPRETCGKILEHVKEKQVYLVWKVQYMGESLRDNRLHGKCVAAVSM